MFRFEHVNREMKNIVWIKGVFGQENPVSTSCATLNFHWFDLMSQSNFSQRTFASRSKYRRERIKNVLYPQIHLNKKNSQEIYDSETHLTMIPADGTYAQLCAKEFGRLPPFDCRISENAMGILLQVS